MTQGKTVLALRTKIIIRRRRRKASTRLSKGLVITGSCTKMCRFGTC